MSGDPFPLVSVEVAFEPSTNATPTYTDVSADHVEAVETSFKLGRQYETDTIEPGTGTLQLNNDGGNYTGNRPSSPYYPYVKPQRRVRLRAIIPPGNLLSDLTTFVATAAGWATTTNATVARAATPVMAGTSGSLAVTATAAGTVAATTTPRATVTAGATYTAAVWARAAATGRTLAVAVGWYNGAGALLSTSSGAPVATITTDYTQAKLTAVAPAGAVTAAVVATGTGLAAAEKLYLGAPTFRPGVLAGIDLATGRISSFGAGWPGGVGLVSRTDVPFGDGFARLKRHTLGSAYREDVLLDHPFALYPLQEPAGATTVSNIATTQQPDAPIMLVRNPYSAATSAAVATFGESSIVQSDPGPSLKLTPEVSSGGAPYYQGGWVVYPAKNGLGPLVNQNGAFTFELVLALNPPPDGTPLPPDSSTPDVGIFEQVDADGGSRVTLDAGFDTTAVSLSFGSPYFSCFAANVMKYDGAPHHVVCRSDGTIATLWLDGVRVASTDPTRFRFDTQPARELRIGSANGGEFLNGSIAYFGMYDYALPDARIRSHNAARLGFPGERADARIGRVLNYVGWPAADRTLEAGLSPLGPHATTNVDAVTALQATANDDGGATFVDPSGRAIFQNRYHRLNQSAKWTLDTALQDVNADLNLQLDDGRVLNIVTADTGTGSGGATVRVTDEASRADYGDIAATISLNLRDPVDLEAAAYWTLGQESQPQPRSSTLTVDPLTSPVLWPFALTSALGDVVSLVNLPPQAPASSMAFVVESKTWTYVRSGAEGRWTVQCEISPYLSVQAQVATFTGGTGDTLPSGITDPHTWDAFADFDGSDVFAW